MLNDHALPSLAFPHEWRWQDFILSFPAEDVRTMNTLTFRYNFENPPETFHVTRHDNSSVAFRTITFEKIAD
jgi:hypothetical protein